MVGLILDTDIGDDVDDAFALAYAVRHPEIRLLAVTTVLGDVRWRAALALRLLDELGAAGVPVAAGCPGPWPASGPSPIAASGDAVVSSGTEDPRMDPRHAVDLIPDAARAAPIPVWLATIGPATNAAAALRRRPELHGLLAGVAMMGGRNDPANPREHNFGLDPEAAAAVCNSGIQVKVGEYNVTSRSYLGEEDLSAIRAAPGAGRSLELMLRTYLERRSRERTSMYDPAALSLVLGERFLKLDGRPFRASLEGRLVKLRPAERPTRMRVAESIDVPAFRSELLDTIRGRRPA